MGMNSTRGMARMLGALVAGAMGTLVTLGAVAYACSAQAVLSLQQSSGSPGVTIAGTGSAFSKTLIGPGQQVQIRWNSTSDSVLWAGPSDAEGRIAFEFKIPDTATNGHYSIVATQGGSVGRTPFEVVGGAPSPTNNGSTNTGSTGSTGSTNTGSTGSTNTGSTGSTNTGSTSTGGSTTTDQAATGSTNTAGTGATTEEPAASSTSGAASSNGTATASPSAAGARVVAPGSSADPSLPRAASPAPRRSDGSAADPATAAVVSPGPDTAATPAVVADDEPTPSAASAAGDMWSGFDSGPRPSLSSDAATTRSASGGSMLPGLVLFGTGLVAFAGGLSLTLTRRRRALATTTT